MHQLISFLFFQVMAAPEEEEEEARRQKALEEERGLLRLVSSLPGTYPFFPYTLVKYQIIRVKLVEGWGALGRFTHQIYVH